MLKGLMIEDIGVTDGILRILRRWRITLLLRIDRGDIRRRITMSIGLARLLAVPDEIFEILYC